MHAAQAEIEKVQKRREDREQEKEQREKEQDQLSRDRAIAEAVELEKKEDEVPYFQLTVGTMQPPPGLAESPNSDVCSSCTAILSDSRQN